MINEDKFEKIMNSMDEKTLKGLSTFADFLIDTLADENPTANLMKQHREFQNNMKKIMKGILDIKEDKERNIKADKLVEILNQFNAIISDFEKEGL